jgi:hypothetical protein
MKSLGFKSYLYWALTGFFFTAYYLYFLIFCRYHLAYQEQIQLFRFDSNYFVEFLHQPGGISEYLGSFLIQFYPIAWVAASIVTLSGIFVFFVSRSILIKLRIPGQIWALIPALITLGLQSNHNYKIDSTLSIILNLLFFRIYCMIHNETPRFIFGFSGWLVLYFFTGGYAFSGLLLFGIFELINANTLRTRLMSLAYLLIAITTPYVASRFLWYLNTEEAWGRLIPYNINTSEKYGLFILLLYVPLLMVGTYCIAFLGKKRKWIRLQQWRKYRVIAGFLLLVSMGYWVLKEDYDKKTEILLGIDYNVQHKDWNKVLEFSSLYPGSNRMITYFTNIALYNKGQLGDRIFEFNQVGTKGLYLDWKSNNLAPFFGGELYYQLSYTNESFRWAFESMESIGLNPRSLKRLILTSIINGDDKLAKKYLRMLVNTLFYNSWAKKYESYLNDTNLRMQDIELNSKQQLSIHNDFWADDKNFPLLLSTLLQNHPSNRMAFEYYMTSLLFDCEYNAFVANLSHLRELNYTRIPTNYEEVLLVYMAINKKNAIPNGYTVNEKTRIRFSEYIRSLARYKNDPKIAAKELYKQYGNTFWYYANFYKRN